MWFWVIFIVLILLLVWWIAQPTVPIKTVYFDINQPARGTYMQPLGPDLTQRIDWFDVYATRSATQRLGNYFIQRYDVDMPATQELLQSGTGTFYFPEGTITFALTIRRKETDGDPSTIDRGYVFSYPLIAGTGRYAGIRGQVTFDTVASSQREVRFYAV